MTGAAIAHRGRHLRCDHSVTARAPLGAKVHGPDHRFAERPAAGEVGHVRVLERHGLRAYPQQLARDQRSRPVGADVVEQDLAVGADGVEGELLALDELLDADLGHVARLRDHRLQFGVVVHPMRVGGTRAGDGLDDGGIADALDRGLDLGPGVGARMVRHPNARGVEHLLHRLLVAEWQRLGHRHAGQPKHLADARRQHHERLPLAFDLVDAHAPGEIAHLGEDRVLVAEAAALHVHGEVAACDVGQRRLVLVAHADHAGAGLGQPARELGHFRRIARGKEQDVHEGRQDRTAARVRQTGRGARRTRGRRSRYASREIRVDTPRCGEQPSTLLERFPCALHLAALAAPRRGICAADPRAASGFVAGSVSRPALRRGPEPVRGRSPAPVASAATRVSHPLEAREARDEPPRRISTPNAEVQDRGVP